MSYYSKVNGSHVLTLLTFVLTLMDKKQDVLCWI